MPRKALSADQKNAMQSARKEAKVQKDAALQAILDNPQFRNPKFWSSLDALMFDDVADAIAKAKKDAKKGEIAALRQRLAKLEGEL